MSARLARTALQSATRRAQTTASSAARVSRRAMSSSTSHGAKSSDTPWLVGSVLVFGPALLYLVSPTARKHTPHVHNDKHDYPTLHSHDAASNGKANEAAKEESSAPEVIMKDDEGTPADVGSSLALSEAHDAPKAAQSSEDQAKLQSEAESDDAPSQEEKPADTDSKESQSGQKSGTYQKEGEEGPTNMSKAKESAQEGVEPKKAAESKN